MKPSPRKTNSSAKKSPSSRTRKPASASKRNDTRTGIPASKRFGRPSLHVRPFRPSRLREEPKVGTQKQELKTPAPRRIEFKKVDRETASLRLDKYLKELFPGLPFGRIQNLIRTKQVKVNGKRAEANQHLVRGDEVRIPPIENREDTTGSFTKENLQKHVVFKDANIIAINKPSGLAVQGGSKIKTHVDALLSTLKYEMKTKPLLVHRLDKETSGLLLLARTPSVARALGEMFKGKSIQKTYIAVVEGKIEEPTEGVIKAPLLKDFEKVTVDEKGQKAESHYKVLMHEDGRTIVALSPKTGRTHQLRVHMAYSGHPIVGDTKYGDASSKGRLLLHAYQIEFMLGDKFYDITAPLPSPFPEHII